MTNEQTFTFKDGLTIEVQFSRGSSRPTHAYWKEAAMAAIRAGSPIYTIKTKSLYTPWNGARA
jgi:hypothetical protein